MDSDRCRVYLCGAHSTGKTTLWNELKPHLKLYPQPEHARGIVREHGWTQADINPDSNPDVFDKLQSLILQKQCEVETQLSDQGLDYICDRGIDPLVYAGKYRGESVLARLMEEPWSQTCIARCRGGLVFVMMPQEQCVFDDNVRIPPTMSDLMEFTEYMTQLLDKLNIRYTVIPMLDLQERVTLVVNVIKRRWPQLCV